MERTHRRHSVYVLGIRWHGSGGWEGAAVGQWRVLHVDSGSRLAGDMSSDAASCRGVALLVPNAETFKQRFRPLLMTAETGNI